ncbi:MAG: UbiA family prenyltransferase [Candidatus Cyclobacteriaceae bacterium M2_1C_046]
MATLLSKSTILHLRFPFSIFLLPIFLFALAVSPNINPERLLIVFVCLHFLVYPASNGFNSYYDKDEDSIGGLKKPPKVTKDLLWVSLFLDLVALILAIEISFTFAVLIFIYGLVSKAYSHPAIRLKKYPWLSWFVAGFFQGAFTFITCYIGLNDFSLDIITRWHILFPALLSSALLWASYPMTQIYQHEEDKRRGDITLSVLLGVKGTFIFTAVFYMLSALGFLYYFIAFYQIKYGLLFLIALSPAILYFLIWFLRYLKGRASINYGNTMALNWLSSLILIAFFIYFFLDSTNILQVL